MSCKQIKTEVSYTLDLTQLQLDKLYGLLTCVEDQQLGSLMGDISPHVEDGSFDAEHKGLNVYGVKVV